MHSVSTAVITKFIDLPCLMQCCCKCCWKLSLYITKLQLRVLSDSKTLCVSLKTRYELTRYSIKSFLKTPWWEFPSRVSSLQSRFQRALYFCKWNQESSTDDVGQTIVWPTHRNFYGIVLYRMSQHWTRGWNEVKRENKIASLKASFFGGNRVRQFIDLGFEIIFWCFRMYSTEK